MNPADSDSNNHCNKQKKKSTRVMPRPLSGKPFFTTILSKSQVNVPYQLVIPTGFFPHLPTKCVPAVLSVGNKEWEMKYFGDRGMRRLDGGWKRFVIDNKLKIGDGCVFELMDTEDNILQFEVRILSGKVPKQFANSGSSSEIPVLLG